MLSTTLRQLGYVVAIERHGGMSAAASSLNISQPALSVALRSIETELGRSLFLRHPGGPMVATSFGRAFLPRARTLLDSAVQLMAGDAVRAGPVTLAVFTDLAPVLLAPILTKLKASLPEIEINAHVGALDDITPSLIHSGIADLAITYDLGLDGSLVRRELVRLPLQVVVAAGHRFARDGSATMAQVAQEGILLTDQGLSRAHMLRVFSDRGFRLAIAHMAGTTETMRSFAANGLGVGLSYTCPHAEISYDGKPVRHVPIVDAEASEPIVLVHQRADALSLTAEAVATMIASIGTELGIRPGSVS